MLFTVGSIAYLIVIICQFNGALDRLLLQLGQFTTWSYKKVFTTVLFICLFVCANTLSIILSFYVFFTSMNPYLLPLISEKDRTSVFFYSISSVKIQK